MSLDILVCVTPTSHSFLPTSVPKVGSFGILIMKICEDSVVQSHWTRSWYKILVSVRLSVSSNINRFLWPDRGSFSETSFLWFQVSMLDIAQHERFFLSDVGKNPFTNHSIRNLNLSVLLFFSCPISSSPALCLLWAPFSQRKFWGPHCCLFLELTDQFWGCVEVSDLLLSIMSCLTIYNQNFNISIKLR